MAQTWNVPENTQSANAIDFALVIAGWPTIYTVSKNYSTLPSTSGTDVLSTANGFVGPTKALANIPDSVGVTVKGRPEEGSCTIAQLNIDLLDRGSSPETCVNRFAEAPQFLVMRPAEYSPI